MRMNDTLRCESLPCRDVNTAGFYVPHSEIDPERVRIVLISECAAAEPGDNYDAAAGALFARTTVLAFQDAGAAVTDLAGVMALGVYLTTAIKCAKIGYAIGRETIQTCSELLERELDMFSNVGAYLLMGDVAIAALNAVARRRGDKRVVPAGPTYKIRGGDFRFQGARVFPSYLQAGPSFFIEKSKRKMIAEDIAAALAWVEQTVVMG